MSTKCVQHVLSYLRMSNSNSELCDTVIHCKDGTIHCHSLILAAVGLFWKNLFISTPLNETFHVFLTEVEMFHVNNIICSLLLKGK